MTVEIRQWKLSDAADLAYLINNKNILNNLRDGLPYPYTVKDAREFIAEALQDDFNEIFAFAVIAEGRTVGNIGIYRRKNIYFRTAELGYFIGEEYWNRGIATRAVKKACKYVFENTDVVRIYAEPFSRNRASCRVLEKAGFTREGTLRANAVKNGVTEDMEIYAIVKL